MKWTEKDLRILHKYYPTEGVLKCMELLPERSRGAIQAKVRELSIKSNRYNKWTSEEIELFKTAWVTYSMKDLLNAFPNRDYTSLVNMASRLNLHSEVNRHRLGDLSFLDLDNLTKESAYWWGYIMADGHLSKTNMLMLSCTTKDQSHLEKLQFKIGGNIRIINSVGGYKTSNTQSVLCIQDVKLVKKWKSILRMLDTAKTYFPPDLNIFYKKELFVYFFLGFVDGDGCLWLTSNNTWPNLKIEIHKNWFNKLEEFQQYLADYYKIVSKTKLSKKGTAILTITVKDSFKKLLTYVDDVDCMKRKWDKIKALLNAVM